MPELETYGLSGFNFFSKVRVNQGETEVTF